ncbi:MAG: ATP-binding protein [Sedimenticola sp.]
MTLRGKLITIILPLLLISIIGLGTWHYHTATIGVERATRLYLDTVLKTYIESELERRQQLLISLGVAHIHSFQEQYQQEAVEAARRIAAGQNGDFIILDEEGRAVVITGPLDRLQTRTWIDQPEFRSSLPTHFGTLDLPSGSATEGVLLLNHHYSPWKWQVIFAIDNSEHLQDLGDIRNSTLLIAGLLAIVTVFLIYTFSQRMLLLPIEILRRSASRIARREQVSNIPLESGDELGELARNMEVMATEIQNAQAILEERVVERTEELADKNRLFKVIGNLQAQFIREPQPTVMFDKLLMDIIDLTGSEFGFIGDVLEDDNNEPYLKCYAFSNIAWNDETRRFYEENRKTGFVFTDLNNLFGHVILDREPIISNSPASDPRSKGLPKDHPPINSFLGIPVFFGERLVGVIGLANRDEGFSQELLNFIQPIVDTCGQIIVARWERESRHRAEDELSSTRNYLHNIIELMPSILVGIGTGGEVTQWNIGAEEFSGIGEESALGRPLESVLPVMKGYSRLITETIQQQQPQVIERISLINGSEQHQLEGVIYPLGDAAAGAVIRIDDITEKVRLESLMIQTEKMMSVGGLAAGMAHELNNPLGGILQGLQNIERRLSPELPKNLETAREIDLDLEKVRTYFEQRGISNFLGGITDSGKRAADIVKNMLMFSRKPDAIKRDESLNEIVEQALALANVDYDFKKKYDFRNIRIKRQFDTLMPEVPCIASEIQQVLLNLFRNAAQALSYADTESPTITISTLVQDDHACIEIEDNGPGMEEEVLGRIFEPFFTTREVGSGTGLGLSVSFFIIQEEHNGTIRVESKPGAGAKFIIELPLTEV